MQKKWKKQVCQLTNSLITVLRVLQNYAKISEIVFGQKLSVQSAPSFTQAVKRLEKQRLLKKKKKLKGKRIRKEIRCAYSIQKQNRR